MNNIKGGDERMNNYNEQAELDLLKDLEEKNDSTEK